jgi:hypothetical protein
MSSQSDAMPLALIAPTGSPSADSYVPGVCNIGAMEIRRRRAFAVLGIALAIGGFAALVALGAPPWMRLVLVLPLTGGIFSWLQARRRFCAAFAVRGLANFGDDADRQSGVQDADARRADLAAVRRMTRDALVIAVPVTIVLLLLPI